MNEKILQIIGLIAVGASLVAYAQATFTTKEMSQIIRDDIYYIKQRVDSIHEKLGERNGN